LVPYYGEGAYDRSIKLAITPNEPHLVPPEIEEICNVGESSIDMNSLFYIADKLGVYDEFAANEANEARKEYYYMNSSMDRLLNEKASMIDKLNALLMLMQDGIILVDFAGKIYLCNTKAQQLLEERSKVLLGFNIEEILPEIKVDSAKEKLIKIGTKNLVGSAVEIYSGEETAGHIITISDFAEVEEKQHGMRTKIRGTTHTAKYHFEDIIGSSNELKKAIENGKQIAATDGAVMITGESGTGKEMFAQSIHNASLRCAYNFVAVNCAAIPEHLLESEMFGYEGGAFTGAKKEGKIGFFELAHRGTIFLDEVAEMPIHLQTKLLRVLEEKKVMRVGSNKNIDVDVRIIAATNKDLYTMVEEGAFREDLYYRINVLPLELPALRNRAGDIVEVFSFFKKTFGAGFQLTEAAKDALLNYPWRGNLRELRNVTEFLSIQDKRVIDVEDLPVMRGESKTVREPERTENSVIDTFLLNEGQNMALFKQTLDVMYTASKCGRKLGRQGILKELTAIRPDISEGDVRSALKKLSDYGYVKRGKGRGGSSITLEGEHLLLQLKTKKIGFIGE
jgi:transcriptional regulator with PAS, ATPase and Fis domain